MRKPYKMKLSREHLEYITKAKRLCESLFMLPQNSLDHLKHRHREYIIAMQIAQLLVREYNGFKKAPARITHEKIGELIGSKDHSNVLQGIRKLEKQLSLYSDLRDTVKFIEDRLEGIDTKFHLKKLSIGLKSIMLNPDFVMPNVTIGEERVVTPKVIIKPRIIKKINGEYLDSILPKTEEYNIHKIISENLLKKYDFARGSVINDPNNYDKKSHYNYIKAQIDLAILEHNLTEKYDQDTLRQIDMLENRILCHKTRMVPTKKSEVATRTVHEPIIN